MGRKKENSSGIFLSSMGSTIRKKLETILRTKLRQ